MKKPVLESTFNEITVLGFFDFIKEEFDTDAFL